MRGKIIWFFTCHAMPSSAGSNPSSTPSKIISIQRLWIRQPAFTIYIPVSIVLLCLSRYLLSIIVWDMIWEEIIANLPVYCFLNDVLLVVSYSDLRECLDLSHGTTGTVATCGWWAIKTFPGLRGLKGPGPALPEVKIKNLINEENIVSFVQRERESWSQGHQCQWEGRILLSGDHQYLGSYAERQRQDVSHDCLDNVCCKYCSQDKETFHSLHSSANLEKQQSNQNLGFLTLALERKSQPGGSDFDNILRSFTL